VTDVAINIEGSKGIGDKIQWTSIPESFYKFYGTKLIDIKKSWVFDHNPYIRRDVEGFMDLKFKRANGEFFEGIPCVYCEEKDWVNPQRTANFTMKVKGERKHLIVVCLWRPEFQTSTASRSEWANRVLRIDSATQPEMGFPRGPRLYKYEDPNKVKTNQITIHVGPSNSTPQFIPSHVLNEIKKRYSNYEIFQIGSEKDYDSPFIDKRGLSTWETVKLIAESAIFIGINSGPMNIANCYPHINKKLILHNDGWWEKDFERFEPIGVKVTSSFGWADFGWQYYTTDDYDVGRMYSYKRI